MRQGNNIVADGWAGASNPDPHPHPHPTHKNTKKLSRMLIFPLFYSVITDQGTDGQMKPHKQLRVQNQKNCGYIVVTYQLHQIYKILL